MAPLKVSSTELVWSYSRFQTAAKCHSSLRGCFTIHPLCHCWRSQWKRYTRIKRTHFAVNYMFICHWHDGGARLGCWFMGTPVEYIGHLYCERGCKSCHDVGRRRFRFLSCFPRLFGFFYHHIAIIVLIGAVDTIIIPVIVIVTFIIWMPISLPSSPHRSPFLRPPSIRHQAGVFPVFGLGLVPACCCFLLFSLVALFYSPSISWAPGIRGTSGVRRGASSPRGLLLFRYPCRLLGDSQPSVRVWTPLTRPSGCKRLRYICWRGQLQRDPAKLCWFYPACITASTKLMNMTDGMRSTGWQMCFLFCTEYLIFLIFLL